MILLFHILHSSFPANSFGTTFFPFHWELAEPVPGHWNIYDKTKPVCPDIVLEGKIPANVEIPPGTCCINGYIVQDQIILLE
tara:strand:+ start:400 stop:645 length:246 start_codon:yes stop_codon:yes gene_type:complete